MTDCKLILEGDRLRCTDCTFDEPARGRDVRYRRMCRASEPVGVRELPVPPPLGKRLANFSLAAINHFVVGSPTCSQQQIDDRYAACVGCALYLPDGDNPEIGTCTHEKCGCGVSREAKFVSKLAWADQQCPLGKWPAT